MNKQIEIINVESTSKPTKNGSYTMLDITYKDMSNGGKVDGKKIMSFASPDVFKVLSNASKGNNFTITTEKNEKTGYWDWTSAVTGGISDSNTGTGSAGTKSFASPKSTYETPEERATRQVYIIRQSSLTNAINVLKTEKNTPTRADVFELAQAMVDWVMEKEETKPFDIADMQDDIPL